MEVYQYEPVRVSSDGKVSFVRPGKSNVVVTSKYGGITDTCVIIVDSIHVESFELKQHEMTIDISKSGRLEWIMRLMTHLRQCPI